MNGRPRARTATATLTAIALSMGAAAAQRPATAPNATAPTPPPAPIDAARALCAAWIVDVVDRDPAAAQAAYRQVEESGAGAVATIATSRIAEMDRLRGDLRSWRRRGRSVREALGRAIDTERRAVPRPDDATRRALAEQTATDDELEAFRTRLRTTRIPDGSRPLCGTVVQALRRAETARATALREELASALARGDTERATELRRALQVALQGVSSSSISSLRRTAAELLERHLDGEHDRADELATRLQRSPGQRRWLRRGRIQPNRPAAGQLAAARRRLEDLIADPYDLASAQEQRALVRLRERIDAMRGKGQVREALELVARLPFYGARLLP